MPAAVSYLFSDVYNASTQEIKHNLAKTPKIKPIVAKLARDSELTAMWFLTLNKCIGDLAPI